MTDERTDLALDRLAIERSSWFAKLEVASAIDADQPGFWGDRSLRDLLVHLNFWQAYKNARLKSGSAGDIAPRPWPADLNAIANEDDLVDAINAYAHEQSAHHSTAEVIAESHRLWNEQIALIEAMPAEVRTDPNRFPMFEGQSLDQAVIEGWYFEHYHDEHGPELARLTT